MQTDHNIELLTNLMKFDQLIRDTSERHPNEFKIHLEFPAVARQREKDNALIGYLDEVLFYTAQALNHIDDTKKLKKEIAPLLIQSINEFLDMEAKAKKTIFTTEERKICLELAAELAEL